MTVHMVHDLCYDEHACHFCFLTTIEWNRHKIRFSHICLFVAKAVEIRSCKRFSFT